MAGATASVIGGFPTVWAQNIKDVVLRQIGLNVSNQTEIEARAKEDLGFTVKQVAVDIPVILSRGLAQPKSLDILDADYFMLPALWPTENFQPIDSRRIHRWDDVIDLYKTGKLLRGSVRGAGHNPVLSQYVKSSTSQSLDSANEPTRWLTALPYLQSIESLGVRPDLAEPLLGRSVRRWSALVDPVFSGRAALQDFPAVGYLDSALAFRSAGEANYDDIGFPTTAEIDRTLKLLTELKRAGHWRALWGPFTESVNLMASGEVVIQSMWSQAVAAIKDLGIPAQAAELEEGYRSWGLGLMIMSHVGGLKLEAAYDYLNWHYSGWPGAFFSRMGYYSALPLAARAFLEQHEWDYWYDGKAAAAAIKDPFGNVQGKPGSRRDGGSFRNRLGNVTAYNTVFHPNAEHLASKWQDFRRA